MLGAVQLDLVAIVVSEYDPAIDFFVGALGFELVEDSPALTTSGGRPKRWVVVRPPGAATGVLLARADGERQAAAVGNQVAGRVGFFLRVEDFDAAYARMTSAGVEFVSPPRTEPYGRVAVFLDIAGNRWDLLGSRELAVSGRLGEPDPDRAEQARGVLQHRQPGVGHGEEALDRQRDERRQPRIGPHPGHRAPVAAQHDRVEPALVRARGRPARCRRRPAAPRRPGSRGAGRTGAVTSRPPRPGRGRAGTRSWSAASCGGSPVNTPSRVTAEADEQHAHGPVGGRVRGHQFRLPGRVPLPSPGGPANCPSFGSRLRQGRERRVAGGGRAVAGPQHHGLRARLGHGRPVPEGEVPHPSHQPLRRHLHPAGTGLPVCHRDLHPAPPSVPGPPAP